MTLAYMFFLHFIADFVLQPRVMGRNKSETSLKGLKYLSLHLLIQFIAFFAGLSLVFPWQDSLAFATYNTILHGIIDAWIWKFYAWTVWRRRRKDNYDIEHLKRTWKYWDDHLFYCFIGLDQFLHFTTIVYLWYYILVGGNL